MGRKAPPLVGDGAEGGVRERGVLASCSEVTVVEVLQSNEASHVLHAVETINSKLMVTVVILFCF